MQRLSRQLFVVAECPAVSQLLDSVRDPARIAPNSPLSKETKWMAERLRLGFFLVLAASLVANLVRYLCLSGANPWYKAFLYACSESIHTCLRVCRDTAHHTTYPRHTTHDTRH